jgi:acetyl-CoA carboxylase carboxyl transferase subunit alpha
VRLAAADVQAVGLCDDVLAEPRGGAHRNVAETAGILRTAILRQLTVLFALDARERLDARQTRLETLGRLVAVARS